MSQKVKQVNKKNMIIILVVVLLMLVILYFASKLVLVSIVTKDKIYDDSIDVSYKEVIIDKKVLSEDEYYKHKNVKFKNLLNDYDVTLENNILKGKKEDKVYFVMTINDDIVAKMYNELNKNNETNETLGFQMNSILLNLFPNAEKDFVIDNNIKNGLELEKLCVNYISNNFSIFDSFKKIAINGTFLSSQCYYYGQTFFDCDNYKGVYGFMSDNNLLIGISYKDKVYNFYFKDYFEGSKEEIITQVEDFISSIVIE